MTLTPRQQQVYDLILRGMSNKEIAHRLGISLRMAKYHSLDVLHKTGHRSRIEILMARIAELEKHQ